MSQISCGKLSNKNREDWTEEEIKEWDQYARRVADQIAYDKFRGIPHFFVCHTSFINGNY